MSALSVIVAVAGFLGGAALARTYRLRFTAHPWCERRPCTKRRRIAASRADGRIVATGEVVHFASWLWFSVSWTTRGTP